MIYSKRERIYFFFSTFVVLTAFSLHLVAILQANWIIFHINRGFQFLFKAGFWDYCVIKGSSYSQELFTKETYDLGQFELVHPRPIQLSRCCVFCKRYKCYPIEEPILSYYSEWAMVALNKQQSWFLINIKVNCILIFRTIFLFLIKIFFVSKPKFYLCRPKRLIRESQKNLTDTSEDSKLVDRRICAKV